MKVKAKKAKEPRIVKAWRIKKEVAAKITKEAAKQNVAECEIIENYVLATK